MHRPLLAFVLGSIGLAGAVAACSESQPDPVPPQPQAQSQPKVTATPRADASVVRLTEPSADAGGGEAVASVIEPPPYDGPFLGALYRETPIMSDMEWPKKDQDRDKRDSGKGAVRIGYIRQGQKVPVLPEPHAKSNCKDGWYELVQGGFVCGRYATLDLNHPKMRVAPHPPDVTAALPYAYGYNVANGTPLYRTLPSREERVKLEPWLAPKPKKVKVVEEDTASLPTDDTGAAFARSSDGPSDAGLPLTLAKATTTVMATTTDPFGLAGDAEDAGTPWYLRQYDGGKPLVTLDDLRGEGPVVRRMVKGFFVALDKELNERGSRWWRTTYGLMAPYDRIYQHNSASKFHGVWLDDAKDPVAEAAAPVDGGDAPIAKKATPDLCKPGSKSQVAIITRYKGAKKYVVSASRKAVTTGDPLSRYTVLKLTGDTVLVNGARYEETDEGWWMRSSDAVKTDPPPPPKDLAPGEKWIAVNIKSQTLVAFEGDKPVFATAVSTGRENKQDKANDHKTPTGTFRIREKHIAATMDGDGATDGPYSIEDVPWIMYYSGSYALHGAFWHDQFGRQKSHGCTNLAPLDAKALFGWTEPRMPEGWHGVWSTPEHPGTRVVVHE